MKSILYLSNACDSRVFDYIFNTSHIKPGPAPQKFHKLIIEGLALHSNCQVRTLTNIPVSYKSNHKRWWNIESKKIENISWCYIPILNYPLIKNIICFFYTFFKTLFWANNGYIKNKVAICDVLNLTTTVAALIACKFTRTKVIAIVTDLPNLDILLLKNKSNYAKFYNYIFTSILIRFDKYIFLTKQMNEVVNIKQRPYLVMEGLVDSKISNISNAFSNKSLKKTLIYAGGIYEKYGIRNLIEAFRMLQSQNLELHIYGHGDMEKDMPSLMLKDSRLIYHGIVPNIEVVESLSKATLLLNPRPSNEEYTKYSFPSKNMEYMFSGTPLVTTQLPGMPEEYNQYVYLFSDETIEGIYITLECILNKSSSELHCFGQRAKHFVMKNKNNVIQAKRLLSLLE